jgi:transcription termination factor NusB
MAELGVIQGGGGDTVPRPDRNKYRRYDWYYHNPHELFENLRQNKDFAQLTRREIFSADEVLRSTVKPLRNPIKRVVEFYATTMLTGTAKEAFPLREVEDAVREAILKLWSFSNLDQLKQRIKRLTALHGVLFVKVAYEPDEDRVSLQEIKAEHVSDYSEDARGHIDYIRLDIPVDPPMEDALDPTKSIEKKTVTEVWRKGKKKNGQKRPGYFRQWTRDRDVAETSVVAENKLGTPEISWTLSETKGPRSLGFDFVPFVKVVAADTAEKWPVPVFNHALPLVEEACKMATRYSELLFLYNKPHRAVEGIGNDPSGRPLPAPEVPGTEGPVIPDQDTVMFAGRFATLLQQTKPDETLNGDIWFGAPGNAKINDITPNIDFEAQRRALEDQINEIRRELPELIYYETEQSIPDSSRAVRLLMRAAIERTKEMRSNIENALIKCNKMGLTMAQIKGIEGFEDSAIGTYDEGEGFDHTFEETEIVETSDIEKEEVRGRRIANMIALMQLGFTAEQAAEEVGMAHLKFPENAPTQPGMDPMAMSVGTGGNPAGGTNLENAAARVERGLTTNPTPGGATSGS